MRRENRTVTILLEPRPVPPDTPKLDPGMFMPITSAALGVTLHVDLEGEDSWLEVAVDYDELALSFAYFRILNLGLEIMGEDECPWTTDENGTVRSYLAERE